MSDPNCKQCVKERKKGYLCLCMNCHGHDTPDHEGEEPGLVWTKRKCFPCEGKGMVVISHGFFANKWGACTSCLGKGRKCKEKCPKCKEDLAFFSEFANYHLPYCYNSDCDLFGLLTLAAITPDNEDKKLIP